MSVPECGKPSRVSGRTCIQALANGWIGSSDLCPACTTRFIAALDTLGEQLDWHPGYLQRAQLEDATNAPSTTSGGHNA